ncbi:site-specific integrase [Novosphingobium sp. AP12]|uniref:site-specific integrase n=1 Tax=Novosphingobium sp. AP12 TaxID=1144305 RepID=UPI000271F6AD|nr:site-specific integrase [Novosphingobium sp. AP12]EJL22920.1 site-specific recombinase XerD [Novosphingobium sp. AP12]
MNALTLNAIVAQEMAMSSLPTLHVAETVRASRHTAWASELPGFGLRRYASGKRVFLVQARMGGRSRTVTIGDAKVVSRAQALDVARRVLLRAQTGDDPAEVRQRTRRTPLYESFLQEFWTKVSPHWKASTRNRNSYYRKHLEVAFPRRFLDGIAPGDVAGWFADITASSGPGAANRALELLRTLFNKAETWGVLPPGSNPCEGIKRNRLRKHECLLSADELARFGRALADLAAAAPMHAAAITLIALTGCRKGEISALDWSEVKGRRLLLHDAKTGPRTVWIGIEAAVLLSRLPRHPEMSWVFWNGEQQLKPYQLDKAYYRVRSFAGLEHVRMHDLRHSFASHAAVMSETLPMIGKLLGHSSLQMTARYAHLYDDAVVQANEGIGALLVHMMGESPAAMGRAGEGATLRCGRGLGHAPSRGQGDD